MKKVALLLAAAMLALAGCASAGDTAAASEAAPAESTAESAAAEDSTEAALPGEPHPLSAYSACAVSGSSVYTAVSHFSSSEDSLGSFDHSTVYKTDLTTGQTYEMYRTGSQLASAPLIIDDTLYFICYDGGMLALPTTGGEARVLPFSYDDWMPVFYAGHYLYCRSVSAAPFCEYNDNTYSPLCQFLANNTLYVVMYRDDIDTKLLAVPLDGGEVWEIPLGPNTWGAKLYNDRYVYCMSYSQAPTSPTCGMRLDLKTGASETWDIPIETYDVLGVADGGIVTSRIVSDYPIPLPSDAEMLSAILQNSTYEFDLTDPATGRPIQKIFEYPCDGTPEGDGYITYTYAGKNGSDFYFIADHMTPSYWTGSSVLCIHSDGTQEDLGIMTAQKFIRPMHQNEALRWFMVPNDDTPRTYTFYDLQGNEIGHNAAPAGVDVALIMEYLLDDGRVVLTLGGDPAHNYAANYATIPADAFLSGSTEYTEMEFVG